MDARKPPRMKTLADPQSLLAQGLAAIRTEFQVPDGFPPEALTAISAPKSSRG